jgi:acyl-CoA reductase-like NAD-dependent aldehyde dehydrogenase
MGLGASVWSNDPAKAGEIGKRLEAGNVWINTHFDLSPLAPFGGHKESGIGTEWGINGLKGFCNVQTLFLNKDIVAYRVNDGLTVSEFDSGRPFGF